MGVPSGIDVPAALVTVKDVPSYDTSALPKPMPHQFVMNRYVVPSRVTSAPKYFAEDCPWPLWLGVPNPGAPVVVPTEEQPTELPPVPVELAPPLPVELLPPVPVGLLPPVPVELLPPVPPTVGDHSDPQALRANAAEKERIRIPRGDFRFTKTSAVRGTAILPAPPPPRPQVAFLEARIRSIA